MKMPDNIKIGAYLDGELPLEQSAEVEASLSEASRVGFQKESALDARLAEHLTGPQCPDALWKNVKRQLRMEKQPAQSGLFRFPRKRLLWLPLAASVAILAGLYFTSANPAFMERVSSVAALRLETQLKSPSAVFSENGFNLAIKSDPPSGHSIDILGGYTAEMAGESVAVVCIDCCGEPLRVIVASQGGRAAKEIRNSETVQTVVWRGDLQLAVIGEHLAADALSLFHNV